MPMIPARPPVPYFEETAATKLYADTPKEAIAAVLELLDDRIERYRIWTYAARSKASRDRVSAQWAALTPIRLILAQIEFHPAADLPKDDPPLPTTYTQTDASHPPPPARPKETPPQ